MMRSRSLPILAALLLAGSLAAPVAFAEKPEGAGGGKGHKEAKGPKEGKGGGKQAKAQDEAKVGKPAKAQARAQREDLRVGAYFSDQHRQAARSYYGQRYGAGKGCPPGLAKKNNGCLPPGQAKKWVVGQPLPAGVVVYSVPQPVLVHLPPAPVGYRYVRVASDILLIAIGTQMVVDGISDLMRL